MSYADKGSKRVGKTKFPQEILSQCAFVQSRTRWEGHVAGNGAEEGCIRGFGGKKIYKDHLQELRVDERIILVWISKKSIGRSWTGWV
jgi:hypothetical protein